MVVPQAWNMNEVGFSASCVLLGKNLARKIVQFCAGVGGKVHNSTLYIRGVYIKMDGARWA